MPIIDGNGRVITKQEFDGLVKMMQEQYKNLITEARFINNEDVRNIFINGFNKRL